MINAICQNCLRVRAFSCHKEAHSTDCECGATQDQGSSYCACEACSSDAERLLAGERNPKLCGIDEGVDLSRWTPGKGLSEFLGARPGDRGSAS